MYILKCIYNAHTNVQVYTSTQGTQTERHTDLQTYRLTDLQTYRLTDTQYRHTTTRSNQSVMCRSTDTDTDTDTDM